MKRARRRKCLCCGDLFRADARNRRHQRYCTKAACRGASKAASQRRWLGKPENREYFRGAINVARVRAWRAAHPGYWRRGAARARDALQEDSVPQAAESAADSSALMGSALQEVLCAQPTVLIGLIAHLTDSALQEDIARTSRRLLQLGQDILRGGINRDGETRAGAGALAAHSGAVQLARSAPGA